jgi:hypothetical protein
VTTPRRRRMWDDVLPRWRASHNAARLTATSAEKDVLAAVHLLLAAHQRTEDRLRLSQIAYEAGLWDGTGDCPRSAAARVGRRLQALHDHGAITYQPALGRGPAGLVALPDPDENRAPDTRGSTGSNRAPHRRDTDGQPRATDARNTTKNRAPHGTEPRASRSRTAPLTVQNRAPQARAPEEFSEGYRGEPEEEGASGGGSADAPPTSDAPTRRDETRHAITTGRLTGHHALLETLITLHDEVDPDDDFPTVTLAAQLSTLGDKRTQLALAALDTPDPWDALDHLETHIPPRRSTT